MNLEESFPEDSLYFLPKEKAYEELKELSGQDFGYEVDRWKQWAGMKKAGPGSAS